MKLNMAILNFSRTPLGILSSSVKLSSRGDNYKKINLILCLLSSFYLLINWCNIRRSVCGNWEIIFILFSQSFIESQSNIAFIMFHLDITRAHNIFSIESSTRAWAWFHNPFTSRFWKFLLINHVLGLHLEENERHFHEWKRNEI